MGLVGKGGFRRLGNLERRVCGRGGEEWSFDMQVPCGCHLSAGGQYFLPSFHCVIVIPARR